MTKTEGKSVLVVFGKDLPQKSKAWWNRLDQVIAPSVLGERIQGRGLSFVDIKTLTKTGNVRQSYELLNALSRFKLPDGSRLSKAVNWRGYELWWMHYGDIYYKFCFSYNQYRGLLEYLKDFDQVYLYQASYPDIFLYFLKAYGKQGQKLETRGAKLREIFLPGGILIQLILSALFLVPLMITRPKVMYRIGDRIDPPHSYDFRHEYVYRELGAKKIKFFEFVRSLQPWRTVLYHAWQRKRPVIYCTAITYFIFNKLSFFESRKDRRLIKTIRKSGKNPEETFWLLALTHYLKGRIRATQWSIKAMQWILQLIGARAAIIFGASSRNMTEVLGCKMAGVKTVGVEPGIGFRYYIPHDFMPEYDGAKSLSLDKFGLWSEWWKEYFLTYSKAYTKEQLFISGPMRPLEKGKDCAAASVERGPLKVLFISEEFAEPNTAVPYLLALLNAADFILFLKFRPQFDSFADFLTKNEPGLFEKLKIVKGDIQQAISQADVVVGSHSTAVLEGLCQLKPFVSFWTDEWGDHFEIKNFDAQNSFFAENPQDLVEKVRQSREISEEDIAKLQTRFFGDPRKNGSQWAVEQIEKELALSEKHGAK